MSQLDPRLVWAKNEGNLPPKNRIRTNKLQDKDDPPASNWKLWLGVAVPVIIASISVGFFFGTLHLKAEFGERMAGLETSVRNVEKTNFFLMDKYITRDSKAQAERILKGKNVQVAYVTQKSEVNLSPLATISSAPVGNTKGREFVLTAKIEGFAKNLLFVRFQVRDKKTGEIAEERLVQIPLSTEIGKRNTYGFKVRDRATGSWTEPVEIEIVVLERVGSDGLVVAAGLSPTPTSSPAG